MSYIYKHANTKNTSCVEFTLEENNESIATAMSLLFNSPIDYVFGLDDKVLRDVLQDPSIGAKVINAGSATINGSEMPVDIVGYQTAITHGLVYDEEGNSDIGILYYMGANATFQQEHYFMVSSNRWIEFFKNTSAQ